MIPHRRKANRTTPQRLRDTALKPMLFYVALTELEEPGCSAEERPMFTLMFPSAGEADPHSSPRLMQPSSPHCSVLSLGSLPLEALINFINLEILTAYPLVQNTTVNINMK